MASVHLTWGEVGTVTVTKIERKEGVGAFQEIDQVVGGVLQYDDAFNFLPSTEYRYRVRSSNSGGDSLYSNEAAVLTPPAAPTNLTATYVP